MRTLIIQEGGRHEANRNYRESLCILRAFNYLKIGTTDVWGLGYENFHDVPDFNSYDLIFNLENYDTLYWLDNVKDEISKSKAIKILWSIDAHYRGEEIFEKTFDEGCYDLLLHSTKDFVKKAHHRWFPNAFDDTLIKNLNIPKENYVGFCGNVASRGDLLKMLDENLGVNFKSDIFVIGDEMVKAINSYVVHFNASIDIDINYRNFETIGCGTALMTNYNPHYQELGFKDGYNCIIYKSINEILPILSYYQNNKDELDSISKRGYLLSRQHTYKERVKLLLDYYNEQIR